MKLANEKKVDRILLKYQSTILVRRHGVHNFILIEKHHLGNCTTAESVAKAVRHVHSSYLSEP